MNKRILLIWTFLLCLITGTSAKDITIDFSTMSLTNGSDMTKVTTPEGATVVFSKGTNTNNSPKYYASGTAVRIYGGNTMTVSAEKKITAITLTFGTGDGTNELKTDCGTFKSPTWTGSSNAVIFTVDGSKGHRRIMSLTVTTEDEEGGEGGGEEPALTGDITLDLTEACDITARLNELKAKYSKIGKTSITLAPGVSYTMSGPIEVPGALSISTTGDGNATIDASQNMGAFISLSATPDEALKGTGDFYHIKGDNAISVNNLNINGMKGEFITDNGIPYCVQAMYIDNCTVMLTSNAATNVQNTSVIYFKKGFVNTLSVTNSTFWNNGEADQGNFISYSYNGVGTRAGYFSDNVTLANNTFYNIAREGAFANYSGLKGQKTTFITVTNNIFMNSGIGQIPRRILGSRRANEYPEGNITFKNNTYITKTVEEGVETITYESTNGNVDDYDMSGTAIEEDPMFADAANGNFTLGAETKQAKLKTGAPRWWVDVVTEPVDIVLTPETGTDLTVAVNDAKTAAGATKNITINLAAGGEYTVSGTIESEGNITIAGAEGNPATINATALTTPLTQLKAAETEEAEFTAIGDVTFKNIKVTNLATQLFYANKRKVVIDNLVFNNSILQMNGGNKTVFDTNGGGVVGKLDIQNSTIYADPQHTGALYSSQSGQKATDAGLEMQTISIQNSTLYNIAYGKNVNTHRSANQKWLAFVVKNNIVIDCGKDGQFVKGLNGGQSGKNPTWNIDTNSFFRTVDGTIENHSAMETTGDEEEEVKNNVEGVTTFASLASGDFTIAAGTRQAKMKIGDPRWLVEFVAPDLTAAKNLLAAEIQKAMDLVSGAAQDNEAANVLREAINKAKGVYNTAEFEDEITKAIEELKAAEDAYTTTAINAIEAANNGNDAWYTLQGTRIQKPAQKGIFIHNGKKVVLK